MSLIFSRPFFFYLLDRAWWRRLFASAVKISGAFVAGVVCAAVLSKLPAAPSAPSATKRVETTGAGIATAPAPAGHEKTEIGKATGSSPANPTTSAAATPAAPQPSDPPSPVRAVAQAGASGAAQDSASVTEPAPAAPPTPPQAAPPAQAKPATKTADAKPGASAARHSKRTVKRAAPPRVQVARAPADRGAEQGGAAPASTPVTQAAADQRGDAAPTGAQVTRAPAERRYEHGGADRRYARGDADHRYARGDTDRRYEHGDDVRTADRGEDVRTRESGEEDDGVTVYRPAEGRHFGTYRSYAEEGRPLGYERTQSPPPPRPLMPVESRFGFLGLGR